MEKYYFIATPTAWSAHAKKMTYKQALAFMQTNTTPVFMVLKTDYNALAKSIKGVYTIKSPVDWIFNRLHAENKTKRF